MLVGCLSLLAFQQVGPSAHLIARSALLPGRAAPADLSAHSSGQEGRHALASDRLTPICEAVLTQRRTRPASLLSGASPRLPPAPICVFHNNLRPIVLRTRAVFCDFALLRRVLHPHLLFLADASAVLC
jgi:hypothetical protein